MNIDDEKVDYYFFFPYLKCSNKLKINSIELFSSDKLNEMEPGFRDQILSISKNFYMSDNHKIKNMTTGHFREFYDLASIGYISEKHLEFEKILKIRELLIYLYSNLHPTLLNPFLDITASNLFIFRKEKQSFDIYESNNNLLCIAKKEEPALKEGFHGLLNEKTIIRLRIDEKIYPPHPSFNQNCYQDIFSDINRIDNNSVFNFITDDLKLDVMFNTERLMRSIQWYNRSLNDNISDKEQLINLSVSFESLLDLDKDKNITSRFKDSINILIGNNAKLDAWIEQFYTARSEIVHRGYANELYYSTEQKKGGNIRYRDLISYGRRIFQILFNTILNSEFYKQKTNLEELFISNNERLHTLIRIINKNENVAENLNKNVTLLDTMIKYKFVGEEKILIKDLLHLITKTSEHYLINFSAEEQSEINAFNSEKDIEKQLGMYFKVHKILSQKGDTPELYKVDDICWHYLMLNVIHALKNETQTT